MQLVGGHLAADIAARGADDDVGVPRLDQRVRVRAGDDHDLVGGEGTEYSTTESMS